MLKLSREQLDEDIGIIQLLHGRLGDELAKSLAYHSGNFWHIKHLDRKNQLVAAYLDILYGYNLAGSDDINALYNILTEEDIISVIDYSYRLLEPYNTLPELT